MLRLRAEFRSLVTNVGCLLSEPSHSGQIRRRSTFFVLESPSPCRRCSRPKQLQHSLEARVSSTLTAQKRLEVNFRVPTPFVGAKRRVCEERLQPPYATTASEPIFDAVLSRGSSSLFVRTQAVSTSAFDASPDDEGVGAWR